MCTDVLQGRETVVLLCGVMTRALAPLELRSLAANFLIDNN